MNSKYLYSLFLIISLLLSSNNVQSFVQSIDQLPYTPIFEIHVSNHTFVVMTMNMTSNMEEYPFLLNNSEVISFIENYTPFWVIPHGPFNRTWGHDNESACFSLIWFNISEMYQLNAWINATTYKGHKTNYSVVATEMVSNINASLFNITEMLLTCIETVEIKHYNIDEFKYITYILLTALPERDGPVIRVILNNLDGLAIRIDLSLDLAVLNFTTHKFQRYDDWPMMQLRLVVTYLIIPLVIALSLIQIGTKYRIKKRIK